DREIDADPADRRHRMRGIADAQQSVAIPLAQMVDFHRQQADVVPTFDLLKPSAKKRSTSGDFFAKCGQAFGAPFLKRTFADDVRGLPIISAIKQDHKLPRADETESLRGIVSFF